MKTQTRDDIERLLELAGLTYDLDELRKWTDMPRFPIKEALRLCEGGTFALHFVYGDSSGYTTIDAEKAIELVLGFAFPCVISTGHVSLETPLGHWEIREQDLSMARYYVVLLLARLWAIKHAPGDLPPSKELQKLYDYLRQVPDQESPDYWEIFDLARSASLRDEFEAELDGKQVSLDGRQIAEEIAPGVVKCELQTEGNMKIWYPDTPDQAYIIHNTPFIAIFKALTDWLAKHNERDPI